MPSLHQLVWFGDEWKDEYWEKMTAGDTFYRAVHEAVWRWEIRDALRGLDDWEPYAKKKAKEQDLQILRAMVWCGQVAEAWLHRQRGEAGESAPNPIDRSLFAMAGFRPFEESREAWAWVCFLSFLERGEENGPSAPAGTHVSSRPAQRVRAPVALVEVDGKSAFLATLGLEVVTPGHGQLVHHPRDYFQTKAFGGFPESMTDAWTAARNLLTPAPKENVEEADREEEPGNDNGVDLACDGTWRVIRGWEPGHVTGGVQPRIVDPVGRVEDRSASGAALRGWWCALQGRKDDDRVIVVAAVEPDPIAPSGFRPAHVDGIRLKMKAIADDGRFDTVVVADEDKGEARTGLDQAGGSDIRVV